MLNPVFILRSVVLRHSLQKRILGTLIVLRNIYHSAYIGFRLCVKEKYLGGFAPIISTGKVWITILLYWLRMLSLYITDFIGFSFDSKKDPVRYLSLRKRCLIISIKWSYIIKDTYFLTFAIIDVSHILKIAYLASNVSTLRIKDWRDLFKSTKHFTTPRNTIKSTIE